MVTNVELDESFLRRSEERVKLLRAGFSGKEIEALYVILNHVEVIGVNWQDLSIKFDRDCAAALTNEELDRIMDRMPCYRCHPLIKRAGHHILRTLLGKSEIWQGGCATWIPIAFSFYAKICI